MKKIEFSKEWKTVGNDRPEIRNTMAELALHVGDVNVMQNEDIWSQTIRRTALLSAYPLAMWLASSWWRLMWEPLPHTAPSVDWRMSHEVGAANCGFVWPHVMFASDRELVQVWAVPSSASVQQSLRYLNGLEKPVYVARGDFEASVDAFVAGVLSRLAATGSEDSDLLDLWNIVNDERRDADVSKHRILEAGMGFDPGECPNSIMELVFSLDKKMGTDSLSELVPAFGRAGSSSHEKTSLELLEEITYSPGVLGEPQIGEIGSFAHKLDMAPWRRGAEDARQVRRLIGNETGCISSLKLYDFLGLAQKNIEKAVPVSSRQRASIGVPDGDNQFKFVTRKIHPDGRRFELARFLGDYLYTKDLTGEVRWLAGTDLSTSRQKYQRAFAAELLCPIKALTEFLDGDFSESAIDEAKEHFDVAPRAVELLLANNGLIPFNDDSSEVRLPYQFGGAFAA